MLGEREPDKFWLGVPLPINTYVNKFKNSMNPFSRILKPDSPCLDRKKKMALDFELGLTGQ